jgi:hypothetical protein
MTLGVGCWAFLTHWPAFKRTSNETATNVLVVGRFARGAAGRHYPASVRQERGFPPLFSVFFVYFMVKKP